MRYTKLQAKAKLGLALRGVFALSNTEMAMAPFTRSEKPDLTAFDPHVMANLETSMWKGYYSHNYLTLLADLIRSSIHVRFSPISTIRISIYAAVAAVIFKKSKSREEAQKALPILTKYFESIMPGSPVGYSANVAAKAELEWWQARREHAHPREYGRYIAQVTSLIYGVDADLIAQACLTRAEAMAYRDSKGRNIESDDWKKIEEMLLSAYSDLKRVVANRWKDYHVV